MKYLFLILIGCYYLICSSNLVFGQVKKETEVILEMKFDSIDWLGDQFGNLSFEKNGRLYLLSTYTNVVGPIYDYYRLFEINQNSSIVKEVTREMLGGFYTVGAPNPPYYYKDIDNDGIKDIFVFDHGKEFDPNGQNWVDYNVFFKGTDTGFIKTEIPEITTVKGYYHGHAIGDFDDDGDNDIAFGKDGVKIYQNDGKGNFTPMTVDPPKVGAFMTPLAMKFINADDDKELELFAPPYRDFENPCCRAQSHLLDYKNEKWEVNNFAQQIPFKNGLVSGCGQVLVFPNKQRSFPDMLLKVETFLPTPERPDGTWLTKFYRNDKIQFDTIIPVKYGYADTVNIMFLDPKAVDFNFDGFDDIFWKQCTYDDIKPVNERLWLNDGNNNFNPIPFKFSPDTDQKIYLYLKSDTIKRYHLFINLHEVDKWNGNLHYKHIYSRLDSLVFPIKYKISNQTCQNESVITQITKVPVKIAITYNPQNEDIETSDSTIIFTPKKITGLYTIKYRIKNDFFESTDYEINYNVLPKAITPTIAMDVSGNLVSSAFYKNQWYRDGVILPDTTQTIRPTSSGLYSVKTSLKGCSSEMSSKFVFIKTSLNELKLGEFIKVYPNPTQENIVFDYCLPSKKSLTLFIYNSSGMLVIIRKDIKSGYLESFNKYPSGLYLILIRDEENNIILGDKIVKE